MHGCLSGGDVRSFTALRLDVICSAISIHHGQATDSLDGCDISPWSSQDSRDSSDIAHSSHSVSMKCSGPAYTQIVTDSRVAVHEGQ